MPLHEPGILRERDGRLALFRIHNPAQRNALSREVLAQLRAGLLELSQDETVGALLIGSSSESVFASGGNIRDLRSLADSTDGLSFAESVQAVFRLIEDFPRPVVAAINGYALGAGAELAVAADIRIASDTARLAFPQIGLGITPGLGGGQRLIRLLGPGRAKRVILLGDVISAQDAFRLGLVELVVPSSDLWATAKGVADKLSLKPKTALELAKRALDFSSHANLESGCAYEALQFGLACSLAPFAPLTTGWKDV